MNGNFSVARVETRTRATVTKFERHIERKNETYENMNVDLARTHMNVQFKGCGELTYNEHLDQMIAVGVVTLRGLKPDAAVFDEMILDVNTDYFENHGGYDYACRFYEEAFHFAEKIYGKDHMISAVMHADELNVAVSERYNRPIYHYHLHVMALPVVDKEIRWTKRCKDPELVGKVKEVVHQVSHSKKWRSEKAVDENGIPILNSKGKQVYRASYSILQDKFFEHMKEAGFKGFSRGERGSTEEHLTVTQFKVAREKERLTDLTAQTEQKRQQITDLDNKIEAVQQKQVNIEAIDKIEVRSLRLSPSRVSIDKAEYETLAAAAQKYYVQESNTGALQRALDIANRTIQELKNRIASLVAEVSELKTLNMRGQRWNEDLEWENRTLKKKIQRYEDIITRHNLWHIFDRSKAKQREDRESR